MLKIDNATNISNLREIICFFNTINGFDNHINKKIKAADGTKIPIILSADDNYSCFIATTGVSILYNTESFIEFYIISDGITKKNKELIEKSFLEITSNFSIVFVECNAKKEFAQIKLIKNYHITLNTCNRLLFPKLVPNVDRAIYLDVDLIVLSDIKELWEQNLDGKIMGAAPLSFSPIWEINDIRDRAKISDKTYKYFNSGVLLIDYAMWRKKVGSNEQIINGLFEVLKNIKSDVTPDEVILNRYMYLNGGYKNIPHKFNVNLYYSYQYLLQNKKTLDAYEKKFIKGYEDNIKEFDLYSDAELNEKPVIRHFFGAQKPWNTISLTYYPMPYTINFDNFWFYAKMTLYFENIKSLFLSSKLKTYYYDDRSYFYKKKFFKYLILNKITFGLVAKFKRRKEKYKILSGY